jgi:hypothetical protein
LPEEDEVEPLSVTVRDDIFVSRFEAFASVVISYEKELWETCSVVHNDSLFHSLRLKFGIQEKGSRDEAPKFTSEVAHLTQQIIVRNLFVVGMEAGMVKFSRLPIVHEAW